MSRRSCWSVLGALAGCLIIASPAMAAKEVRLGSAPVLPRNARIGVALPGTRQLHLTVALQSRDAAGLARYATAVSTPSSPLYRHYLTVTQFAERFGATPAHIAAVQSTLRGEGLRVGAATANNLHLSVTGSASQVERAFSVSLAQVRAGSRVTYANTQAPSIPASIAGLVQGVIGLDNVTVDQPQTARSSFHATTSPFSSLGDPLRGSSLPSPQVITGGPQPCGEAAAHQNAGYTVDQLASAYQLSGLYGAGAFGAGQTIAIFEQEPYQASDIATFQACFGTAAPVTNVDVDGGPGPFVPGMSDDGEAALDIEVVIGIAPKASIVVYQGPGTTTAPVDIINSIVTQNVAKVITSSWGVCEALTGGAVIASENTLLQEAAAQGQTFFISSGDSGSEQCSQVDQTNTSLSVLNPAGQPFATGVGGTTLYPPGPPPVESLWNDGPRSSGGGGTGGGISNTFPMPAYQSTATPSLGVINPNSSAVPCGSTTLCREVPDISADADVETGYIVYVNGGGTNGGWNVIGGTSAAAPLWAAYIGLVNSSAPCRSVPVGFINPLLYQIAGSSYLNNFHDISIASLVTHVSNNDTLNGTGLFPDTTGYDMTTGIGTPIGQTLAASLCALASPVYTVGVAPQAPVVSTINTPVGLQMRASDSGNVAVGYVASGLPAGLAINGATGVISGVPTTPGVATVTVAASDAYHNAGSTQFTWTIVVPGPPTAKHGSLAGLAKGKAKLVFTLASGSNAPPLTTIAVKLPSGLTFATKKKPLARIVVADAHGKHLKFSVKATHGTATIKLAQAAVSAKLTLGYPAVIVSKSLEAKAKLHKVKSLSFRIKTTDAAQTTKQIVLKLRSA